MKGRLLYIYIVMAKNLDTPAPPSDNAPPPPENSCNHKLSSTLMLLFILLALKQHKKAEGKKAKSDTFHTKTQKWTGQNY